KLVDKPADAIVELAGLFAFQWHQASRFGDGHRLEGVGRIQLELGRRAWRSRSVRSGFARHQFILSAPLCGDDRNRSTREELPLYYRCKTGMFKVKPAAAIVDAR